MKRKKYILTGCIVATVLLFQNCSKKDTSVPDPVSKVLSLPAVPYNYSNVVFPAHVNAALALNDNTPANNPITDDGATLGRVLFYDKNVSANNTISCGSCHKQEQGFNDNIQFSKGFEGGSTSRNSMNLLNLRFYRSGKMFWDERANTLEDQVLQPIQNHVEMGMTLADLVTKIKTLPYYPSLFSKAFGTADVDTIRISKAIAQFLRSIVTWQSKYDRVKSGLETFTQPERDGEILFLTAGTPSCGGCHTPPMFLTSQPAGPFALADPNDHGINNQNRFKAGSLRNIAAATNLFHNGSIPDITAMLGSNIPAHGVPPPDRNKILAFLQTLTDNSVTTDVRFSDPFK